MEGTRCKGQQKDDSIVDYLLAHMIQMVTIDEDDTGMVDLVQLEEKLKVQQLVAIPSF